MADYARRPGSKRAPTAACQHAKPVTHTQVGQWVSVVTVPLTGLVLRSTYSLSRESFCISFHQARRFRVTLSVFWLRTQSPLFPMLRLPFLNITTANSTGFSSNHNILDFTVGCIVSQRAALLSLGREGRDGSNPVTARVTVDSAPEVGRGALKAAGTERRSGSGLSGAVAARAEEREPCDQDIHDSDNLISGRAHISPSTWSLNRGEAARSQPHILSHKGALPKPQCQWGIKATWHQVPWVTEGVDFKGNLEGSLRSHAVSLQRRNSQEFSL
ncbi:hypothetical protein AAFF_G00269110 [Aldrovandia affinis]|uniref:Uncharacterized protein n=1 Tax=Aldrovandia affinis TaxID=143900 RepID=A0AAD7SS71_9TELE|nr:hypothetical protein AAFF_G00269110 [Aldrovandia affinis]